MPCHTDQRASAAPIRRATVAIPGRVSPHRVRRSAALALDLLLVLAVPAPLPLDLAVSVAVLLLELTVLPDVTLRTIVAVATVIPVAAYLVV